MAEVHGSSDPAFNPLRETLRQRIEDGRELGAAICVNVDGKNPWNEDTITVVFSCTKVVAALAALILAERGLLDLEAPIAKNWPEFAVNGKENIKETFHDTKKATELLAQSGPPWWTPGEHSGYHMSNQGHFTGELVRRITGKSLTQFIDEEIATPLNVDFSIGVAEKDWPRTADVVLPPPFAMPPDLDPSGIVFPAYGDRCGERVLECACPDPYWIDCFLGGTVDGKEYLSPSMVDNILQERVSGHDLAVGLYLRFGLGVGLPVPHTVPYIPEGRICFWGGGGGSMFIMDTERKMTFSYVMKKMGQTTLGNENTGDYIGEIYKIVDALRESSQ